MSEAAFWRQHVLRQRNPHRETAKQHGEDDNDAGENGLGVFGCGQVDRGHQLTAGGSLGSSWSYRLAFPVGIQMLLTVLQLVVRLVAVQRLALDGTLHVLKACCEEGRWWLRAGGTYSDDGAFPHLYILSEGVSNHQVRHRHHGNAKGKVCKVNVQHDPGLVTSQAKVRQTGSISVGVRSHGEESGHGEAGGPQQGRERQRAREGGRPVRLLPQNHAQSVQSDDGHRLQGHDDEARAGQMEGKAEALGHAVRSARVQEEHQRKHGSSHAADEKVAEGQVQDHEVKVGAELAKYRIEEGEEHHQVAVRAQAEDEDEEKGAKGQRGGVDHGPAARCLSAIEDLLPWHIHQV